LEFILRITEYRRGVLIRDEEIDRLPPVEIQNTPTLQEIREEMNKRKPCCKKDFNPDHPFSTNFGQPDTIS